MSEFAGELKVKIVPDTQGFQNDLQTKMAGLSPRVQAMLQRTGLSKALEDTDRAGKQLAQTETLIARRSDELAQSQARVHTNTLRSAAGFTVLGIATRNLVNDFGRWAETQDGVVAGLGKIATGISNLDLLTTGKGIGETVAQLDPRNRRAAGEARAATQRLTDQDNAISIAKQLLTLRQQTAKAEGQVGTAAGATKFQLQQQLRLAQAAFAALDPSLQNIGAASLGLKAAGGKLVGNEALAARNAAGRTDSDRSTQYQLNQLRAGQTESEKDDVAIANTRRMFLEKQIANLEKQKSKTNEQKERLSSLYGELAGVEDTIDTARQNAKQAEQDRLQKRLAAAQTDLQIQAANARGEQQEAAAIQAQASFATATARDKRLSVEDQKSYELQAAQANKQLYQIQQQQAERAKQAAADAARAKQEEIAAEKQRYRDGLSLQEQRLQIRVQAAQLTGKNLADDRKALKAEIAFYKAEQKDRKLSVQERLTARSNEISARLQLKGLSNGGSGSGQSAALTSQSFFSAAASQFNTYGSNIAGRNGVLSGQDARAQFAARALSGNGAQAFAAAVERARATQATQQLAEAQRQTALLHTIAAGVRKYGVPGPVAASIGKARGKAFVIGGH